MSDRASSEVVGHYAEKSVLAALKQALSSAGLGNSPLTAEQLAPLDQFHSRGLAATIDMARAAEIVASDTVLDLGSGLGGPSRWLASTIGCHVTGIDLTEAYVEAATWLAGRTGLGDKVHYRCENALALPFDAHTFDVAWTQHVVMNIEDRAGFYAEAHRMLRPGGRLVFFDVLKKGDEALHFPVPWSRTADTSFLFDEEGTKDTLTRAGFSPRAWVDHTTACIAWFDELTRRIGASPPPVGLGLVLGPDFGKMAANLRRNLAEGRAIVVGGVLVAS